LAAPAADSDEAIFVRNHQVRAARMRNAVPVAIVIPGIANPRIVKRTQVRALARLVTEEDLAEANFVGRRRGPLVRICSGRRLAIAVRGGANARVEMTSAGCAAPGLRRNLLEASAAHGTEIAEGAMIAGPISGIASPDADRASEAGILASRVDLDRVDLPKVGIPRGSSARANKAVLEDASGNANQTSAIGIPVAPTASRNARLSRGSIVPSTAVGSEAAVSLAAGMLSVIKDSGAAALPSAGRESSLNVQPRRGSVRAMGAAGIASATAAPLATNSPDAILASADRALVLGGDSRSGLRNEMTTAPTLADLVASAATSGKARRSVRATATRISVRVPISASVRGATIRNSAEARMVATCAAGLAIAGQPIATANATNDRARLIRKANEGALPSLTL
jgi:hypothetical protein